MECLVVLIDIVGVIVWDVLIDYLQYFQKDFLLQFVFELRKREDVREGCVCFLYGIIKLFFCLDFFIYLCDLRYFIFCCYILIQSIGNFDFNYNLVYCFFFVFEECKIMQFLLLILILVVFV